MRKTTTNNKSTSIAKALTLLRQLGKLSAAGDVKLSELSGATGFNKATVHRMLSELKKCGLVEQNPASGAYNLGHAILVLSAEYHAGMDLRARSLPVLQSLTQETGLTAHLAVRDGNEVVYIEKVETTHNIRVASGIGWRGGLHCTSLGKALLAFDKGELLQVILDAGLQRKTKATIVSANRLKKELDTVRQLGYSVDDEENQEGVRCVAAPIIDRNLVPIAAISVSGTTAQLPLQEVPKVGELVKKLTLELNALLGYSKDLHNP